VQQRRQEHEEHDVGLERDVRERGDQPDRQAADDQHDRVRDRGEVGQAHERGGGQQQDDEELEVAQGRPSLRCHRWPPSSTRRSARATT
jgi:hypothetical protein